MKKFVKILIAFIGLPLILLAVLYLTTDPFKTLKPFSLEYFDNRNRDYLSSELFIYNNPRQHYDSFIFGSSRACGINSYHWRYYLPKGSNQFVFQSWSETLTGIEQKISYLDSQQIPINNAIILIDIPGSFVGRQAPIEAIKIKDYHISGQSFLSYQLLSFFNFIQKPSIWIQSVRDRKEKHSDINFDTISNDWSAENKNRDISIPPIKDSLNNCSNLSRRVFVEEFYNEQVVLASEPLLTIDLKEKLSHIKSIFEQHHTDYVVIVTPAPCYTNQAINPSDLQQLDETFGKERVFNYSGKNSLTVDPMNFSDPNHFSLYVGWQIIEEVYNK